MDEGYELKVYFNDLGFGGFQVVETLNMYALKG